MATTSETWFERVMWVGIFANVALALPTLLWPAEMLALSRLPDAIPLVWVRFSSLLLILLSSFYVPAALDCRRARVNAWLATSGRLAGVIFFAFQRASIRFLARSTSCSSCRRRCCWWRPVRHTRGSDAPGRLSPTGGPGVDQRTVTIRRPAGALGAVAADCVMITGCPATVSVPVRDDEPPFAETR